MLQRFGRRLHFIGGARWQGRCGGSDGGRLNANLRCVALRTEGSSVFYLRATFRTGMFHEIKLSAGKMEMQHVDRELWFVN